MAPDHTDVSSLMRSTLRDFRGQLTQAHDCSANTSMIESVDRFYHQIYVFFLHAHSCGNMEIVDSSIKGKLDQSPWLKLLGSFRCSGYVETFQFESLLRVSRELKVRLRNMSMFGGSLLSETNSVALTFVEYE